MFLDSNIASMKDQGWIQRFWKGGALYVSHHGWPATKVLDFRWFKKAEIALETKAFGETLALNVSTV